MTPPNQPHQPVDDVIYLASCAVREITPDPARVAAMDLDAVYTEAQRQLLAGCCAFALESVNMCKTVFTKAKARAIRKTVLQDRQRQEILDRLEKAGIWHLPLKGIILKDYYPGIGMREMSDNDILFDATRAEDLRTIMVDLGFEANRIGIGAHDNYYKQPLYNFEMHRALFTSADGINLSNYYSDVKSRLQPDEETSFGYHFTPEDFYLFMVAHEYKHFNEGGSGVRSCLDTYVYLTGTPLDMKYIAAEAKQMGIADFELMNRNLSIRLINGDMLTDSDNVILDRMKRSGVYGNVGERVSHRVERYGGGLVGKSRYVLERIVLPMATVEAYYPFFFRHKILLPLLPFVRFGKMLTTKRMKAIAEIKSLHRG